MADLLKLLLQIQPLFEIIPFLSELEEEILARREGEGDPQMGSIEKAWDKIRENAAMMKGEKKERIQKILLNRCSLILEIKGVLKKYHGKELDYQAVFKD